MILTRKQQATVLYTYRTYTARLCDQLATMRKGQLSYLEDWRDQDYLEKIEMIENLFYPGDQA